MATSKIKLIFLLLPALCADANMPTLSTSFVARYPFSSRVEGGSITARVPFRPSQTSLQTVEHTNGVPIESKGGGMSTRASVVSLTKNIIGAGVFALPAGMATGAGTGQVTATLLAVVCCLLST